MKDSKKWYQSISNWLVIIGCIILIPMLIINIYIMIQSKTNQDKVPSVFGIKPFIVLSGSMEDEIYKGDLIFTKNVEPSRLKVNDVIAFRDSENTVTTHRIIDLVVEDGQTYFITKGDNNNTQDQNLVSFKDVEGIYITRIPGIGSIMNSLSEPTTIIILLLGITLIFIIGFMISNKKQREQERKEFLEYKIAKEEQARQKEEKKKIEELALTKTETENLEIKPQKSVIKKTTPKTTKRTTTKNSAEKESTSKRSTSKTDAKKASTTTRTKSPSSKTTTTKKNTTTKTSSTSSKKSTTKKVTPSTTKKSPSTKTTTRKSSVKPKTTKTKKEEE